MTSSLLLVCACPRCHVAGEQVVGEDIMEGKVTAPIAKAMILFKTKAERQHIWDTVKGCGIASNNGDTQAKHQARHHRRAPHAHHLAAPPQWPPPACPLSPAAGQCGSLACPHLRALPGALCPAPSTRRMGGGCSA